MKNRHELRAGNEGRTFCKLTALGFLLMFIIRMKMKHSHLRELKFLSLLQVLSCVL